ncbi:hypothetical protein BABINDRAFT_5997 [Babjeviella inositovora NRRL Y-12698]|uniref:Transcription activator GCR1-like domain-containing protein n=1 Tax=Babjeviella inositovora NRRL Y-12698 TaxID=984486 RepID=A0A1E3QZR7_9ASCO|nr:uncharacterized protein BABINDRAFT_5997 [Babjeviella inositovora NRRL Y-12698]ODQ83138.1 hypothetical protein BABINDRAFT_5997 [Babjeviella inositovora NRRL Y-12698]
MDREIVSVIDLYREWFIPGADGLCVETLERGSKAWRKGPQNKTFFLRRKVVIEEIVKVARETGKPQVEIAQMFERVRSERNIGLAKLASAIKKGEIKVV